MKSMFSKLLLILAMVIGLGAVTGIVNPEVAMAACTVDPSSTDPIDPECNDDIKIINKKIYSLAYILGGLVLGVAVVMIVYAGFKYATSQGDPKASETAKMQIISAGIGIFIVMLAFIILRVFTGAVTM